MAKKKVCKESGLIVDESVQTDPLTGSTNFANTILGRMVILNPAKSKCASMRDIKQEGEYAINWR